MPISKKNQIISNYGLFIKFYQFIDEVHVLIFRSEQKAV